MSHYLQERYRQEIAPALMKEIGVSSPMEVPRLEKIVVNVGVGEALENAKALDAAERLASALRARSRRSSTCTTNSIGV